MRSVSCSLLSLSHTASGACLIAAIRPAALLFAPALRAVAALAERFRPRAADRFFAAFRFMAIFRSPSPMRDQANRTSS
jgi:hypothetical protein